LPPAHARVRRARARRVRGVAAHRAPPRSRAAPLRAPRHGQPVCASPRRAHSEPAEADAAGTSASSEARRGRAAERAGGARAVCPARCDAGGTGMSHRGDVFFWLVLPYVPITIFVVGHWWRSRTDQFGWTSRSTQLLESRMLAWGSNLFHWGALAVIA